MKKKNKIIASFLVIALVLAIFCGCSSSGVIKKVSKNLTNYTIDAVFCDDEKKVSAIEYVEYKNNTNEVLNSICFNLYGKAFSDTAKIKPYSKSKITDCFPNGVNYGDMIINSVLVENQNVDFNIIGEDNNALEVLLNAPLEHDKKINITIEFVLYLANCTHRLGYNNGKINLGNWYPIVAVYENGGFDISPYYANGDPFYSEVANYNVNISYSDKYNLFSTGNLENEVCESGVKKSSYNALAVRDFAMVMLSEVETKSIQVEDTTISVGCNVGDENVDVYLETAKRSLLLFNQLFGKYPYETLNVVFTDFCQGGMEYPNLVYISNSVLDLTEIKKVIVHEIAHQWWYGLVGNDEVSVAWFDEGLAEYSTLLYFENYPDEGVDSKKLIEDTIVNYQLYLDVIKSLNIEINYSMELPLNQYSTEYEYVYMIYVKGLLFFDNLRTVLGDEVFFDCLKDIYDDFKFKTINKEKFIASIEKTSSFDTTEIIEGWLSGNVDISQ